MKTILNAGLFTLLAACSMAQAASVYETHREVIKEDETEHFYERTTIQGENTRVDFIDADGNPDGSFMLSNNHGATWVLNDAGQSTCSIWNREEFFATLAEIAKKAKKMVKADISSIEQVKIEEQPGEEMLGLSTQHVSLKSHYTAHGRFLFIKVNYLIEETDEMWMTTDWEWPKHEADWMEAATRTGNNFLDEHEKKWLSHVIGPTLKHTNTVTLTNVKSGKVESKTEHFTVTDLREIPDSELAATIFSWPECQPVKAKNRKHQATRMLKKYFR